MPMTPLWISTRPCIPAGSALPSWHADRFAANLKMIEMNSMTVEGDTVIVDGAVSSKPLATWRLKALSGRVTMCFENGEIKQGKPSPRTTNPFNMMREDMGAYAGTHSARRWPARDGDSPRAPQVR
jgi:hypothetical protein